MVRLFEVGADSPDSCFLMDLAIRIVVVRKMGALPVNDTLQYHTIEVNLLAGDEFPFIPGKPTSMRPPALPLFLAIIYAITGVDCHHAEYVQIFLSALIVFPLIMWAAVTEFDAPFPYWTAVAAMCVPWAIGFLLSFLMRYNSSEATDYERCDT